MSNHVALAAGFKALGDPVRLRLVEIIAAGPADGTCVCDITPHFDLTAPTISHHLRTLLDAGLVTRERRGTWMHYRLDPGTLDSLATLLATHLSAHTGGSDAAPTRSANCATQEP